MSIVNTITQISVNETRDMVSIKTSHRVTNDLGLPNTIEIFRANTSGIANNTMFTIADGVVSMVNSPQQIDYNVNDRGELIVTTSIDTDNYSIDDDGSLIYTYDDN